MKALIVVGAIAVLAGCGSGPGSYAGMSRSEAKANALFALRTEAKKSNISMTNAHVGVLEIFEGKNAHGGDAWKVQLADRSPDGTLENVCVTVYSSSGERFLYVIDPGVCGK